MQSPIILVCHIQNYTLRHHYLVSSDSYDIRTTVG